jgi:CRISPR-associated endonuclease/helicase Cas3
LDKLELTQAVGVHVLMGGEEREDWDLYPERDAILIGTQDMLLSRMLNRGYAMRRARWPTHYALLNNDALWVFDEIQLMGSGLATTAQFEAFRRALGTHGVTHSVWMSATLRREWLRTVDLDPETLGTSLKLGPGDRAVKDVIGRCAASKRLARAASSAMNRTALADEILTDHREGTRTLVVLNTVGRARALAKELEERSASSAGGVEIVLVHSRYRPADRRRQVERLLAKPGERGTIVVSTQVVEAGVDVSARTLFTELAPWASLVQRFGRCNRRGEFSAADPGEVRWIDLDGLSDARKAASAAAPYSPEDLVAARRHLVALDGESVAPDTLDAIDAELPFEHTHVLRRKDLLELFDTTPDLEGNDLDVDRYVRDLEETDVRVFWRDLATRTPAPDEPSPTREELCPAPIGELRAFLTKVRKLGGPRPHRRNFLEGTWEPVSDRQLMPGQVILLNHSAGGYDRERGWTGEPARKREQQVEVVVSALTGAARGEDANDADGRCEIGVWQTIAEHTDMVCEELEQILETTTPKEIEVLRRAARWHDRGKAHEVFQQALPGGNPSESALWAKAQGSFRHYGRKHFRHELASALALLCAVDGVAEPEHDLAAYLVAAHHGKVRMSIRSLPGEARPGGGRRFARGVWDGDSLPETDLGGGVRAPAAVLSLEPMELGLCVDPPFAGQPSWVDRTLGVRDRLGPFRLAYLETLLRAADMRASARAEGK